jgi:hypothetical protein
LQERAKVRQQQANRRQIADDVTVIGVLPLTAANSLPGAAFVKSTSKKNMGGNGISYC